MGMSAKLEQGCPGRDSGVSPGETLNNHPDHFGHMARSQVRMKGSASLLMRDCSFVIWTLQPSLLNELPTLSEALPECQTLLCKTQMLTDAWQSPSS